MQEKGSWSATIKKTTSPTIPKALTLGMIMKPTISDPLDMLSMLSQITIRVPLSKLFRIEEHTIKALPWLCGIENNGNMAEPRVI